MGGGEACVGGEAGVWGVRSCVCILYTYMIDASFHINEIYTELQFSVHQLTYYNMCRHV